MAELIHHKNIDRKKWDCLVQSDDNATIFNYSHYIDSLAEDWDLYTDADYSFGIIVPFKKILKQRIAYTPFFYRYADLVGDASNFDQSHFIKCLHSNFQAGNLNLSFELDSIHTTRNFQIIKGFKKKSLAKRQMKKANELNIKLKFEKDNNIELVNLIFMELSNKMNIYKSKKYKENFLKLTNQLASHQQLIILKAFDKPKLIGGLIGIKDQKRLIYLKGACLPQYKNKGLMYLMMNELIQHSESDNSIFDFGGSSDENVRFFNTRFNGIDQSYYVYKWENSPLWFKTIKQAKEWIKK